MADPTPSGPRNWLWPLLIALLGVLLLVWLLNPSGDEDTGAVEDPIVTPDLGEPTANAPAPLDPVADAQADVATTEADRAAEPPPPPPGE